MKLDDDLKLAFSKVMYIMTKSAANYSFVDFIENSCGITMEQWKEISKYLKEKYNVNTYC